MIVKICGITTLEDALAAIDVGADLLGFNFYPLSPRFITPSACAAIVAELRRRGARAGLVGVFVNIPAAEIEQILEFCGLDQAQLSGDESPEELNRLGRKAYKAIRPRTPTEARRLALRYALKTNPPSLLLDAAVAGKYGGTGQPVDYRLATGMAVAYPLLLAGGLNPHNVQAAVSVVHPWGVDVASGVESSPGHKDATKMAAFVSAARAAESLLDDSETQQSQE